MATVLRALIFIVGIAFTLAGPLAVVGTLLDGNDAALVIATLAAVALATPPYLAGVVSSYWSWDEAESRRRLRRALAILIAIQAVAGALLIATVALAGQRVLLPVVDVVVAFALMPGLIALGRAAKRRSTVPTSGDEWVDTTSADIRKGYRNGAIGFAIGAVVAVALAVTLAILLAGEGKPFDSEFIALGISFACIGAAFGMMPTTFRSSRRLREIAGTEYNALRRIGRVVLRNKPDVLSEDEQRRAARYAQVVQHWLPFQTISMLALYVGIFSNAVRQLFTGTGLSSLLSIFSVVLIALCVIVVFPLQFLRIRTTRRYAAAHPVDA